MILSLFDGPAAKVAMFRDSSRSCSTATTSFFRCSSRCSDVFFNVLICSSSTPPLLSRWKKMSGSMIPVRELMISHAWSHAIVAPSVRASCRLAAVSRPGRSPSSPAGALPATTLRNRLVCVGREAMNRCGCG